MPMSDDRKVSIDELVISNMYEQEALVRLLAKKGIIAKEELLTKIREIQLEQADKRREN